MTASISARPRICETCGGSFHPTSNRQKYCLECGRRSAATCEVCGRLFKVNPSSTGRWCSRKCWGLSRRDFDRRPKSCEVCGKTYEPVKADQRFCSQTCYGKSCRREEWDCAVCGKTYTSKHYTNTCSRDCAGKLRRKYADGLNCETCGKHIPWAISRTRRFCSHKCRRSPIGTRSSSGNGGYVKVMTEDGWKLEHRHVMEQLIRRSLLPTEEVHHRNGDRTDNTTDGPLVDFRSGNLELWSTSQPKGQRVADKVEYAVELLRLYRPDPLAM
jgi:predicted nucleic acid-binding Zn ribbon protein